jgi:hypothetical protein
MSMFLRIQNKLYGSIATATLATPATVNKPLIPTVAKVATVAVATSPKQKIEQVPEPASILFDGRVQAFKSKGFSDKQAVALADSLALRDSQLDDRRACAECLQSSYGRCKVGRYPIGDSDFLTLHRCSGFVET